MRIKYMSIIERDDIIAWITHDKVVDGADYRKIIKYKARKIARYVIYQHNHIGDVKKLVHIAASYSLDIFKYLLEVIKENGRSPIDYIYNSTVWVAARNSLEVLKYLLEVIKENNWSQERNRYFSLVDFIDEDVVNIAARYSLNMLKYLLEVIKENERSPMDFINDGVMYAASMNSINALRYLFEVIEENNCSPMDYINDDVVRGCYEFIRSTENMH